MKLNISKAEVSSLKGLIKLINSQQGQSKKKKETQTTNIRNKRKDITTNYKDIKGKMKA